MTVKWFTYRQSNLHKDSTFGSMKHDLKVLAYSIFRMCVKDKISYDVQWDGFFERKMIKQIILANLFMVIGRLL